MKISAIALTVVGVLVGVYGIAVAAKATTPPALPRFVESDRPPLPDPAENGWALLAVVPGDRAPDLTLPFPLDDAATTPWADVQAAQADIERRLAALAPEVRVLDLIAQRTELADGSIDHAGRGSLAAVLRAGVMDALVQALHGDSYAALKRTAMLLTLNDMHARGARDVASLEDATRATNDTVRLGDCLALMLAGHADAIDDRVGSAANTLRTRFARLPDKPPFLVPALVGDAIAARTRADATTPRGLARYAPRELFAGAPPPGPIVDGFFAAEIEHARQPGKSPAPEWPSVALNELPTKEGGSIAVVVDGILERTAENRRIGEHASQKLFEVVRAWFATKVAPPADSAE